MAAVSEPAEGAVVDAQDTQIPWAIPRTLTGLLVFAIVGATVAALVRSADSPPADALPRADGGVAVIYGTTTRTDGGVRVGALAPDFSWINPAGETLRLSALRGRPVILNFWATWCVPCRTEMPALDQLAAEQPEVVILAVDLQEDAQTVREFVDRLGLRALVPILDRDAAVVRGYGVVGLPTSFFVDRDGVIRHVETGGSLTAEHLRADLLQLTRP
jgi:cytochrome c biogenesis protein CcmG/thiol:disulfide interchange protein DsbE